MDTWQHWPTWPKTVGVSQTEWAQWMWVRGLTKYMNIFKKENIFINYT